MIFPLELMAMRWLWLKKGCHYIVAERAPRYMLGEPDVLGVTQGRYLIEIEVKRSASDFRADFKKHHRVNRELYLPQQARQLYYLMPDDLAVKLVDEIPPWAGLMAPHLNQYTVEVLKDAPVNKESKRLAIKECVKMARQMTSHMMSATQTMYNLEAQRHQTEIDPSAWAWDKTVGFYQI